MRGLLPRLASTHRCYFLVMCGLIFMHITQTLDLLLPGGDKRHSSPIWAYTHWYLSTHAWGLVHLSVTVFLVLGLYWERKDLLLIRIGQALSIMIFLVLGACFTLANLHGSQSSWFGVAACGFIIFSALAALLEPDTNPLTAIKYRRG